jgi:carbon monoxide dehydrogenase subunit G
MRIEVSRYVFAPVGVVWDVLTDWERQPEWMQDAEVVEVTSDHRAGVGVELRVPTRVLGVTVLDTLEVTRWEEPRVLGVRHAGRVIAGDAAFELHATEVGTRVVWWEEITPPMGALGALAARLVVRPLLRPVFDRSLTELKRLCEREARRERLARGPAG